MYADSTDSRGSSVTSVTRRKIGHIPKSPENDAEGGILYIRLSSQKKLRKVRNTVYEDPGNPFEFDAFDLALSSPTSQETLTDENMSDHDQWNRWTGDDPNLSLKDNSKMYSMPFDLIETHNPTDPRRDTLRPSRHNRRSMSVDIGFMPERRSMRRGESSDTDQYWPGDVPLLHTRHLSGTISTTESKRDTRFYDFYNDLLAEYGVEKDASYGSNVHRLLSIPH